MEITALKYWFSMALIQSHGLFTELAYLSYLSFKYTHNTHLEFERLVRCSVSISPSTWVFRLHLNKNLSNNWWKWICQISKNDQTLESFSPILTHNIPDPASERLIMSAELASRKASYADLCVWKSEAPEARATRKFCGHVLSTPSTPEEQSHLGMGDLW